MALPESGNLRDNLGVLYFPELSRKPALKTRRAHLDPTLRDSFENGAEATRPQNKSRRRQWDVSIDALTPDDVDKLDFFLEKEAVYGSNGFIFPDNRDPRNPRQYRVRFSVLPAMTDAGNVKGEFRQNCTFQIREY